MNKSIGLGLLFFLCGFCWAHEHIPHSDTRSVVRGDFRYFKKLGDFRLLSEFQASNAFEDSIQHHIDIGAYYRWLSFSKIGLIHRYQKNVRHEDNWVNDNGHWHWNEKTNSFESVLIPHLDFRALLSESIRADFVIRYMYNARNTEESILLKPGLNYFWFRKGGIFATVSLQYEHIVPLNFGNKTLSEKWVYLNFLYHLNDKNKVGLSLETGQWIWTDSKSFNASYPLENYEAKEKANVVGLTYIFTH